MCVHVTCARAASAKAQANGRDKGACSGVAQTETRHIVLAYGIGRRKSARVAWRDERMHERMVRWNMVMDEEE